MKTRFAALLVLLFSNHAMAENLDAIRAQTAGVLASVDFARDHCPHRRINQTRLDQLVKRSKWSLDQLKADESYTDQQNALRHVQKDKGADMVCLVLRAAHGGYARGVFE